MAEGDEQGVHEFDDGEQGRLEDSSFDQGIDEVIFFKIKTFLMLQLNMICEISAFCDHLSLTTSNQIFSLKWSDHFCKKYHTCSYVMAFYVLE